MRGSRFKNRILSLVMSAIMLVGMIPDTGVSVFAADGEEYTVSADAVSEDEAVSKDSE